MWQQAAAGARQVSRVIGLNAHTTYHTTYNHTTLIAPLGRRCSSAVQTVQLKGRVPERRADDGDELETFGSRPQ